MRIHWLVGLGVTAAALGGYGCTSDKSTGSGPKPVGSVDASSSGGSGGAKSDGSAQRGSPESGTGTLYERLGRKAGIQAVITDFLGRVLADNKVNGYFLNSTVDAARLSACLVDQVGSATGGPETYSCSSMKVAHAGLGISKQDFDDVVSDLSAALLAAKVAQADIDTILGVLGPMSKDIVEDPNDNATVYQRVGRKPAIQAVVADFHKNVANDIAISAFFAKADEARLATCLVRQVCQSGVTGGPCVYGKEVLNAAPDNLSEACRDMKTTHTGLNIAKADFDALAGDFVAAMVKDGVSAADRGKIAAAILPLCSQIVEKDPQKCADMPDGAAH